MFLAIFIPNQWMGRWTKLAWKLQSNVHYLNSSNIYIYIYIYMIIQNIYIYSIYRERIQKLIRVLRHQDFILFVTFGSWTEIIWPASSCKLVEFYSKCFLLLLFLVALFCLNFLPSLSSCMQRICFSLWDYLIK